ncbi:MAG TPA: hypothetical protein PLK29_06565 [Chiayiivirga sp.]|nr:hypothetical protein [Chiayiivirga sp.]
MNTSAPDKTDATFVERLPAIQSATSPNAARPPARETSRTAREGSSR